jgi:hypothetical protein
MIALASVVLASTLLPLAQVTSEACISCHESATVDSHVYAIRYVARSYGESQMRAASMPSGFGGTVEGDFLVNGRIECASCHATHEQDTDHKFRLRISDGENPTALCNACHVIER